MESLTKSTGRRFECIILNCLVFFRRQRATLLPWAADTEVSEGRGFPAGCLRCWWGSWDHSELQFSLLPRGIYSLQCVINMEKHHLVLGQTDREEIPFVGIDSAEAGEQ